MDLRAKLAIALVILLVVPFVVVTTVQVDRTITVMAGDLADSDYVLINQTFEQIRTALSVQNGDPVALLRGDPRLQSFLRSSQAFGKGVVYVRVEKLDGTPIIAAAEDAVTGSAPPFSLLETNLESWWLPTKLRALWEKRTYELNKRIDFSNRPAAVIRVGLSTALIGDEARRSIAALVIAGAVGAAIAVIGAIILGAILLGPIVDITAGVVTNGKRSAASSSISFARSRTRWCCWTRTAPCSSPTRRHSIGLACRRAVRVRANRCGCSWARIIRFSVCSEPPAGPVQRFAMSRWNLATARSQAERSSPYSRWVAAPNHRECWWYFAILSQ